MQSDDVINKIKSLGEIIKKEALAVLKVEAVSSIQKNFEQGGRPAKWEKSKKRKGKTLIKSGNMMKVTAMVDEGAAAVIITSNPLAQAYSRIQNEGGTIQIKAGTKKLRKKNGKSVFAGREHKRGVKEVTAKAHQIKIPARPYLVIPPEDFPQILSALEKGIKIK